MKKCMQVAKSYAHFLFENWKLETVKNLGTSLKASAEWTQVVFY